MFQETMRNECRCIEAQYKFAKSQLYLLIQIVSEIRSGQRRLSKTDNPIEENGYKQDVIAALFRRW